MLRSRSALLITGIVLLGMLLRLQDVTAPWVGKHNAWGGATYGQIARNYLTYGYLDTRLAPVANFGLVPPDRFVYHYHYPPLLVWLLSLSYHVFGVSEFSARLVPLAFSVLSIWVVYALGRTLYDATVARWAAVIAAIVPAGVYYGSHIDVYGPPAECFSLLAFLGYARLWKGERRLSGGLLLAAAVLGCLTSWYTYFALAAIGWHWLFWSDRRPVLPRALAASIAAAIVIFASVVVHRYLVIPGAAQEVHATLWEKFLLRTSYTQLPMSVPALAAMHVKDVVRLYSPVVLLLAAAWWFGVFRDWAGRRLRGEHALVVAISLHGLAHNVVFPSTVVAHDFMVGGYAGGIALAAGWALSAALRHSGRGRAALAWRTALVVAVAVSALAFAQRLYQYHDFEETDFKRDRAAAIRAATAPADKVLLPWASDRILEYYAERELSFEVRSREDLAELPAPPAARFYACTVADLERQTLCRELAARFPVSVHGGTAVVRLNPAPYAPDARPAGFSPATGGGR